MFYVVICSAIYQRYLGLSLTSCVRAELGVIWDHYMALIPIGTKAQICLCLLIDPGAHHLSLQRMTQSVS